MHNLLEEKWHEGCPSYKGILPISIQAGCPQISKKLALDLMKEREERSLEVKQARMTCAYPDKEIAWLKSRLDGHPTLASMAEHIKKLLVVPPGEWNDLLANRHQRKQLKAAGSIIVHLYAGEKDGFTLQKAMTRTRSGLKDFGGGSKKGGESQHGHC